MNRHIVYCLIDPRVNEVRYIGKSSVGMKRPERHQMASGRRGDTHNHMWLRQMWADEGHVPSILVLRECDTEAEVLAHEVRLIAMFRAAGFDLTNLTDGGEGACGAVCSAEARAKMSAVRRGKKLPPFSAEHKAKLRAAQLGRKRSPETKAKISAAQLGKKLPPFSAEHRAKISAASLGRKLPPLSAEAKAKISAAQLGKKLSAETKAKISAAKLGRKASPEARARMCATRLRKKQEREKALLTAGHETCTVPAAQETRKESES